MTESEKLQKWVDREKKNGLIDIKLCLAEPLPEGVTAEDVFREINEANALHEAGLVVEETRLI